MKKKTSKKKVQTPQELDLKDREQVLEKLTEGLQQGLTPRHILGLTEDQVEGTYNHAYSMYNQGKYPEALNTFRYLLLLDFSDYRFTFGIAACQHMLKEYKQAVMSYATAYTLDAKNPTPFFQSIDCYLKLKERDSAIFVAKKCIAIAKDQEKYQSIKEQTEVLLKELVKKGKQKSKKKPASKRKKGDVS